MSRFLVATLALVIASQACATTVTYTYEFTGADLFNHQYVDGADGSTASDNSLFDGARLLRVGLNGNHAEAGRTYIASQQANFDSRWSAYTAEGYVFDAFNLWGLDGRGVHWGEDFKPLEWVSATGPTGWTTGYYDWPANWGTPPSGANTTLFPNWYVDDPANAIPMDATQEELENYEFSVTIAFDDTDAFWGQDTNGAPNALGVGEELTFWFGGYLTKYDQEGAYTDYHLYEGNMVQSAIPEPASFAVWSLLALVGITVAGRRRR